MKEKLIKKYFLLILLWLVLLSFNINKAFHIDDTFHLEVAKHVIDHPTKPMTGTIIWLNNPSKFYKHNQPPFFFYLIAAYSSIFGFSEIALHILLSVFTFFALLFFQKVSFLINVKYPRLLLTLFAFSPAFIVNQNIMLDVPILSILLGILFFLLKASNSGKYKHYLFAVLLFSLGLMFKYSVIPIFVVIIISIIINKDYSKLSLLFIPIIILVLWSYWNVLEYGSIHILDRPKNKFEISLFFVFIASLGSMATFLGSFAYGVFRFRITKITIIFIITSFIAGAIFFYFGFINEEIITKYIIYLINFSGYLLVGILLIHFYKLINPNFYDFIASDSFLILLFLSSLSLFIILFAPFSATRHILLIIPFILLFGHKLFENASLKINIISLVITIFLGISLGVSDWIFANFYKKMANSIDIKTNATIWTRGHWGWQWYSQQKGMKVYSTNSDIKDGDYLIFPKDISKQKLNKNIKLEIIEKKWEDATLLTFFSGKTHASLYNSFINRPPWTLSTKPIDTIFICKVKVTSEIETLIKNIKSNEEWLNSVKEKAIKKGITLDSMLILDAKWIIKNRNEK